MMRLALPVFLALLPCGALGQAEMPTAPLQELEDDDAPETLRDEREAPEVRDVADAVPSTLHYGFSLGFGRGSSFSAPSRGRTIDESLWSLRFSLGLPFSELDDGAFGVGFDFNLSYPTSIQTLAGQNTYRFHADPKVTYAQETLFLDDVSMLLSAGLGFGVERIQFPRSTLLGYGPLVTAGWSIYMDKISLPADASPFARMSFRYKPSFSKYQTSDGSSDAEIEGNPEGQRTAFSTHGGFSVAAASFDVGVSGLREPGGSRPLFFAGFAYEWQRYVGIWRDLAGGSESRRSASVGFTTLRIGAERTF